MITSSFAIALVDRLGWVLVHSLWQFTLIALIAYVAQRVLARSAPSVRCLLLTLLLASFAVIPVVTGTQLADNSLPVVEPQPAPLKNDPIQPAVTASVRHDVELAVPAVGLVAPLDAVVPQPARELSLAAFLNSLIPQLQAAIAPQLRWCVAIWCVGVVVFCLRPAWSWLTVQRLRRRGTSPASPKLEALVAAMAEKLHLQRRVRVLLSACIDVPLVLGSYRPTLLLPAAALSNLSDAQWSAIIAHELAHLRRYDDLVNLLQLLLETMFFYHPAVWWLSARIRQEREFCCDDVAARATGDAAMFCRALLSLEQLRATTPAFALGAGGGSLLQRVQRLLPVAKERRAAPMSAMFAAALGTAALVLAVMCLSPNFPATAIAQSESNSAPIPLNGPLTDDQARTLALEAHAKASAMDKLPRLMLQAETRHILRTLPERVESDDLSKYLEILKVPADDPEWAFPIQKCFAWDEKYWERKSLSQERRIGQPFYTATRASWGSLEASGEYYKSPMSPAIINLSPNAQEAWIYTGDRDLFSSRVTLHKFWWGDTFHFNWNYGLIDPQQATYRFVGTEEFDGVQCHVIDSPSRGQRLWINATTRLILGSANLEVVKAELVKENWNAKKATELTGETFEDDWDFEDFIRAESHLMPLEKRLQLFDLYSDLVRRPQLQFSSLTRLRDYREVAPGIWIPFEEDFVDRFGRASTRFKEVKIDQSLRDSVEEWQPRAGDVVQDKRSGDEMVYVVPPENIQDPQQRDVVSSSFSQELPAVWKRFDEMVGHPALKLPEEGWTKAKPALAGRPYLIFFWSDQSPYFCVSTDTMKHLVVDHQLQVVGIRPEGTTVPAEIESGVKELKSLFPSCTVPVENKHGHAFELAGYPVQAFPYAVLVDEYGIIVDHGAPDGYDGQVIRKLKKLQKEWAASQ